MPNTPQKPPVIPPSKPAENKPPQIATPGAQQEQKLNSVVWVILATGAGIIDLIQVGLEFIPIAGQIINIIIDIFVGLSLGTFLLVKGMLNWQTGASIFLGFAVDSLTVGAAPAWIIDIGVVWLQTDGAKNIDKIADKMTSHIPFVGDKVRQAITTAAQVAIQKGKGGVVGAMEKEAAGASVAAKSAGGAKSVDGIKPGTGGETQRAVAKPSPAPEPGQKTPKKTGPTAPSGPQEMTGETPSVKFGDNYWKAYGETRRQHAHMTAIENARRQFGISKEEAERLAGKDWSNN